MTRSVAAALSNELIPSTRPVADSLDEVVNLCGVLLPAQVEADGLSQLRRVADVPARFVAFGDGAVSRRYTWTS